MAPPSSGGICLNQIMKMIEPYSKQMGHNSQKRFNYYRSRAKPTQIETFSWRS
jgi:gamma-glutamyltranspeptidase